MIRFHDAMAHHAPDVAVISVPPPFARDAALEAMTHGIQLIVLVTERVPRHDVVAILEHAAREAVRVIGPNSLGVIAPGRTRAGMAGGASEAVRRAYKPGNVGIVSRSGGMMTEIANMLTQGGHRPEYLRQHRRRSDCGHNCAGFTATI